jgi:hypothetical protein
MRIAHHRWSHALVAGLLLAGCKSNKDKEPATQAQAAAPAAPATKPAAPAPAPVPAPIADATLSYLEPSADEKCRWVQHTPPAEPKVVLTLPSACSTVGMAWRADGLEALAYAQRYGEGQKSEAWRVDLATGTSTPVPLPTQGTFGTIGFDAKGSVVALMEDPYLEDAGASASFKLETVGEGENAKRQLVFEGQRYDAAEDGLPGLTHAFRLEGGAWKRFETKSSSFEWDYAAGYRALDAYEALAPTVEKLGALAREAVKPVPEKSAAFAALSALPPPSEGGGWQQLETVGGPLYAWEDESEEFASLSGPVLTQGEKGLVEPEGVKVTGALSVDVRGDLVLLGSSDDTGRPLAWLWNARTKKLFTSLSGKESLTFWPKPSGAAPSTKAAVAGSPTP